MDKKSYFLTKKVHVQTIYFIDGQTKPVRRGRVFHAANNLLPFFVLLNHCVIFDDTVQTKLCMDKCHEFLQWLSEQIECGNLQIGRLAVAL